MKTAGLVLFLISFPFSSFGQIKPIDAAKDTAFELSDFYQLIGRDTSWLPAQMQKKYFSHRPVPVRSFSICQSGNCEGIPNRRYGLTLANQNIRIIACVDPASDRIVTVHLNMSNKKYLLKSTTLRGLADQNFIRNTGTDDYVQTSTRMGAMIKSKGKYIRHISFYRVR